MAPKFLCIIYITVNMDLILIEFVENCDIPRPLKMGTFWSIFGNFIILTCLGYHKTYRIGLKIGLQRIFNNMNQKILGGYKSGLMTQK